MTASKYPEQFDGNDNLYLVHDALRLRLSEDYNPGDTTINVEGDSLTFSRWPATGILTLTEQCSEIESRAICLAYDTVDTTAGTIGGLVLQDGFVDSIKPKRITNVTINVVAPHHNNLKDSLIAIQEFVGVEGTQDSVPFGSTMEGRINFLRQVALLPKAWFTANKRTGIIPLEVEFQDLSFRLGTDGNTGPVTITWDFGDNTSSTVSLISTISATSIVPEDDNVFVYDSDGGKIKKTYLKPGLFDATITVTNDFGSDTCVFPDFIQARVAAPNEAVIKFVEGEGQRVTDGTPEDGPYTVKPLIRSPINTLIQLEIPSGANPNDTDYTYAGELLSNSVPLDAITDYNWSLGDDLNHAKATTTTASYGIGGTYDLKLRVDTEFGAYRITTYPAAIDIVENYNIWSWIMTDQTHARSYEYGLLSETFKVNSNQSFFINRNDSFLDGVAEEAKQKQEFKRNVGFTPRSTTPSGNRGSALLYWASGRDVGDSISTETINVVEYNGFLDTYTTRSSITRPWNWASFSSNSTSYFVFGSPTSEPGINQSPTNPVKTSLNKTTFAVSNATLVNDDFSNNAQELLENPAVFDEDGESTYGNFSVYRTAWKDSTGYIARNDSVGSLFRIKSFYRTEGTSGSPFQTIRKLTDIQGSPKEEGALSAMTDGIYLFNNSGSISRFNDVSSTWATTGPGLNSVAYRALQDTSVTGYDDPTNTFVLASDGDHRTYLSFDYSAGAFIKYNEISKTFSTLGSRPSGEQWLFGIY